MSQAIIQGIVSQMADAFIAAGLADTAVYYTPLYPDDASSPLPCRVFVSLRRGTSGDFGSVQDSTDTVTLLISEVASPQRDALVELDEGPRYQLVKMIAQDEAVAVWEVKRRNA